MKAPQHTPLPLSVGENGSILDAKGLVVARVRKHRVYEMGEQACVDEQAAVCDLIVEAINGFEFEPEMEMPTFDQSE